MRLDRAVPADALALIHRFEKGPDGGPALTRYVDPTGNWTIGWGHKLLPNDPLHAITITAEQADSLAEGDLFTSAAYLEACLGDSFVQRLTPAQYAALIDFVFNMGIGAFERSTLHEALAKGEFDRVPSELRRWVYGGRPPRQLTGLVERRSAEAGLWQAPP